MTFIWILIIAAAVIVAAVCIEIYRETHNFCVTRYRVHPEKMEGMEEEKNGRKPYFSTMAAMSSLLFTIIPCSQSSVFPSISSSVRERPSWAAFPS